MTAPAGHDGLARRFGTGDAVLIGLGSMIGAGGFVVFGPAAQAAGTGMLVGLLIAAVIAYCNAVASAQLAAVHPTSGGTYIYGRERLGRWWGFTAGWAFVIGMTASCAAMALTFASYVLAGTGLAPRLPAVVAVLVVAAGPFAALTQRRADRRWPRGLNLLGVLGCLTLVATLPLTAIIAGVVILAAGMIGRLLVRRLRHRRHSQYPHHKKGRLQ